MKSLNRAWSLGMLVLGSVLASSCAMGSLSLTDCRPGEPSTNCCIKKFPLSPVESCAATVPEVDQVLGDMVLDMAAEPTADEAAQNAADDSEEDDFANNKDLPEWKQRCIRNYVACKLRQNWIGPCYECLRRCEGQQEWPMAMCRPRRSKKG
ncbi:hypothetical protein NR798_42605 [Archangium gephyra]|uniref:hypothetical protein n=1 Tax=Archangium gephyra TaxID=48 RepID=UPI0035D45FAB